MTLYVKENTITWAKLLLSVYNKAKNTDDVGVFLFFILEQARGVFRTLPCAIASLSLVAHVGKNSTLYCFLPQIKRFAPSLFDSPLTLYQKQKRQHLTALSFLFWWRRGESLLNFAKQFDKKVSLCFAKFFGHRTKTIHWIVFVAAFDSPFLSHNEKQEAP